MAEAKSKVLFAVRLTSALRVKPFISDERVRYYPSGVSVEPHRDGAVCAATDGHKLGAMLDREGFCSEKSIVRLPGIIRAPSGKLLASPWLVGIQPPKAKGHISVVEAAPKKAEDTAAFAIERVEDCTIRIGDAIIDGTFPAWRLVIPKLGDKDTIRGFNGEYVKAFGKQLTMRGADEASPHLIQCYNEPDFVGVLMPMLVVSRPLPEWLSAKDPLP